MTKPAVKRQCKDCKAEGVTVWRNPTFPGPRCYTHHHENKRNNRLKAHGRRLETVYGITREQYDELLRFQGGRCAICRRATGRTKRLAVDHDHAQAMRDGHPHNHGCPNCVRGLVCSPCNDVLAHFRDNPTPFYSGMLYCRKSPLKAMSEGLGSWSEWLGDRYIDPARRDV